jgi:hypothetical protein
MARVGTEWRVNPSREEASAAEASFVRLALAERHIAPLVNQKLLRAPDLCRHRQGHRDGRLCWERGGCWGRPPALEPARIRVPHRAAAPSLMALFDGTTS